MRAVYRKYLKQLVDMQTTILVTGGKECGKSAMIRLFLDKHFNGQLVLRGSNDDSALREASKKLVGMGDAPQNQTLGRKLDYCIYV
jgi:ABC-type polar amino acid transport system ATPase subunit